MDFNRSCFIYNQLYYRYNSVRHLKYGWMKKIKNILHNHYIKSKNAIKNVSFFYVNNSANFFYNIDEKQIPVSNYLIYDNLTPDYNIILKNSFHSLIEKDNNFIVSINRYFNNAVNYAAPAQKELLKTMYNESCTGFIDALQRILFVNQLIWQEGHKLVGLGHLDWLLEEYYLNDVKEGNLTKDKALLLIKEFFSILHEHFTYKSSSLLGDTGQIVILGGLTDNGNYHENELTYLFIQAIKELHLPDPKVLVRVSSKMPISLLEKSVECISTGIGCPLFANDDVIIPKLMAFGYTKEDSYNYGTSACWEPFIIGKSLDANNIFQLNFLKPLIDIFNDRIQLKSIKSYNDLLVQYKRILEQYVKKSIRTVSKFKWEKYPILSLFIQKKRDGSPVYADLGFTTVALANTVNSLFNIKELVFDKKIFTLEQFSKILKSNYKGNEKLCTLLKENSDHYGQDNDESVLLSNDLFNSLSKYVMQNQSFIPNRKIKVGVSSPSYISLSRNFSASPDGRKKGEPFSVHISNDKGKDFTSLFSFAAKLDYSDNRFNGNVIDFMVNPGFIKDNFNKFNDMLMASIKQGIFEMQINVLDSKTLIEAKKHPEYFPNLIVRVWGFSAYFNDLPDSYKDNLIARAIESERRYN